MNKPRGRKKRATAAGKQASSDSEQVRLAWIALRGVAIAVFWAASLLSLSTRTHLVMGYGTLRPLTAGLEPIAADGSVFLLALLILTPWFLLRWHAYALNAKGAAARLLLAGDVWLVAAALPFFLSLVELVSRQTIPRLFWEPLWLAAATGLSYYCVIVAKTLPAVEQDDHNQAFSAQSAKLPLVLVVLTCVFVGVWWFVQAIYYHQSFMLGFNDFGHFAQRVANTASGNGVLLETPVLPMFWDHFNPGLLLLVPCWMVWPDERLFFALQAAAMAGSGILIYQIGRQLGFSTWLSLALCGGWLVQPAAGQMNIAYTYGWHPITLAIPLLLLAVKLILGRRYLFAAASVLLAMSMEEGVIAVVAIWAVTSAVRLRLASWLGDAPSESAMGLGQRAWWLVGTASILAFMAVFKFSGLAEFQTGRFVALGNSLAEVVLSPLLRPQAFWSQLLRTQSACLLLCLLLPLGLPSLWRCKSMLIAVVPPLGVLLVWDHAPATSLAFQYSSSLLPLLWFTAMEGTRQLPRTSQTAAVATALVTGAIMSVFIGQLPLSRDSLVEVKAATYPPTNDMRRVAGEEDSIWLLERLDEVRSGTARVLATGRVAAHLVGCRDIETVGQFIQRRPQLERLAGRPDGLRYYDWIVLDFTEGFQQSRQETEAIYAEAIAGGFNVHERKFEIAILHRADP